MKLPATLYFLFHNATNEATTYLKQVHTYLIWIINNLKLLIQHLLTPPPTPNEHEKGNKRKLLPHACNPQECCVQNCPPDDTQKGKKKH